MSQGLTQRSAAAHFFYMTCVLSSGERDLVLIQLCCLIWRAGELSVVRPTVIHKLILSTCFIRIIHTPYILLPRHYTSYITFTGFVLLPGLSINPCTTSVWFCYLSVFSVFPLQSHIPVLWRTEWEREISFRDKPLWLWKQGYGEFEFPSATKRTKKACYSVLKSDKGILWKALWISFSVS